MAATFPSGTNTYIPSTEATNNMVVDFSRNPSTFKISEWAQYVPVEKNVGRYIKMTIEMAGRILNADGADMSWPDGVDAPSGVGNRESFEFLAYQTRRYASPFFLGELAAEQAAWDILAQHARIHAQRMMTLRTQRAMTVMQAAGNWVAAHTADVTAITGVTGKWGVSTTARKDIKRSFDHAFEQIHLSTLGAVSPDQVMVVMSPSCARKVSVAQEIIDYIKGSPSAEKELKTGIGNAMYGLPETFYGYRLVIEDAVKTTSRKGATKAQSYVCAEASPFMCSRPGELEGVEGAPSFSTMTLFLKEEMTVESKHDRDDRMHKGRVVDDTDPVLTSDISGFLFTLAV